MGNTGVPGSAARARATALVVVVLAVLGALSAGGARAQVFSPGALSKAHSALEDMSSCTRCHGEGSQHDNGRCLSCHTEIQTRKAAGAGYHARLGTQLCAECHREHRGLEASLIEWPTSQRGFNHALTGWPLAGLHKKADCRSCHEPRRIEDADAAAVAKAGRATFLGLPSSCAACHFDEHRSAAHGNRPGASCATCHTPAGFLAPRLFDHNNKAMASFALTGLHRKVDCAKCHDAVVDDATPAAAFPAPKSSTYLQMNDIPHTSCVDCHDDPHRGGFGRTCTQCHSTAGWRTILQTADDFGFHDKTKFPLRGGHTSVACKTCHGPFPGQRAVFKGLPHARCADCHADAHVGQLAADEGGEVRCERCHTVNGFTPVSFDAAAHAKTRFALEGAHEAVACNACHVADDKLARKVPQAVRARLERQKRAVLVSTARLDLPGLQRLGAGDKNDGSGAKGDGAVRCESCHSNPHGGQFDERVKEQGCNACHETTSFRDERFVHDNSRFALTGKHKEVACSRCHVAEPQKKKRDEPVVRYRPLPLLCASCHVDEHVGQLARAGVTDCARCHETTGFQPSTFSHADPAQTAFVLEGKHKDLKCAACHVAVSLPPLDRDGESTSRYKPVPTRCADCHDDEHRGRFDRFAP